MPMRCRSVPRQSLRVGTGSGTRVCDRCLYLSVGGRVAVAVGARSRGGGRRAVSCLGGRRRSRCCPTWRSMAAAGTVFGVEPGHRPDSGWTRRAGTAGQGAGGCSGCLPSRGLPGLRGRRWAAERGDGRSSRQATGRRAVEAAGAKPAGPDPAPSGRHGRQLGPACSAASAASSRPAPVPPSGSGIIMPSRPRPASSRHRPRSGSSVVPNAGGRRRGAGTEAGALWPPWSPGADQPPRWSWSTSTPAPGPRRAC